MHSKTAQWLATCFALCCVAYAVYSGVVKPGDRKFGDGRFMYVAGTCWLHGESPYDRKVYQTRWMEEIESLPNPPYKAMQQQDARPVDLQTLEEHAVMFPYPPSIGVVVIPVALLPWDYAMHALAVLSLLCAGLSIYYTVEIINRVMGSAQSGPILTVACGGCFLFSAVPATSWTGQMSLISLLGCVGATHYALSRRYCLAGLFITLASIKPQMALLLILYLLVVSRDWRLLVYSSLICAAVSLGILLCGGDLNPIPEFLDGLALRQQGGFNDPQLMGGAYWLVAQFVEQHVTLALSLIGIAATVLVSIYASSTSKSIFNPMQDRPPAARLQTLILWLAVVLLTTIFMPVHSYDRVIACILLIALAYVRLPVAAALIPGVVLIARSINFDKLLASILGPRTLAPDYWNVVDLCGSFYLAIGFALLFWHARRPDTLTD
jgi:hypothetical protein